ncbi:MAG: uroporphyrinogen decarboxylase family protein [Muricomes sp.]
MSDIKDFNCTYDNSVGISEDVTKELNLEFPEAYKYWESMADIARALKRHDGADFCELPFCHTVEAEAMGGIVNYGNEKIGPRAKEYICTDIEELLALPEIDYSQGRIHEVLLACRHLREQGENVVLEVAGPFTILNVLIDARYVFKGMRKKPEVMKKVYEKFGKEILHYLEEAQKYGVNLISYADSSGGVNILGPKAAGQVVEEFTYPFLKEVEALIGKEAIVLLCPKTTLALLGTDKAEFTDVELEEPMRYGQACVDLIGKEKFAGQMCIKNIEYRLENKKIKAVRLL